MEVDIAMLDRVPRKTPVYQRASEQTPEGNEGVSHEDIWEKDISEKRK